MKVIDLTHTITENMPVYPGTEAMLPAVTATRAQVAKVIWLPIVLSL